MLVIACLLALLAGRSNAVLVAAALALFGRLDAVPLLAPLLVLAWRRSGEHTRARLHALRSGLLVGALVLGGWLVFATIYYGYPLPNTWVAKGGLRVGMGLRYLGDFASLRPSSALVLIGGPLVLLWRLRGHDDALLRAAALGVLAQVGYVIAVGGDYMHGRFFTAALLVACVCTVGLVARAWPRRRAPWLVLAGLGLLSVLELVRTQPEPGVFVIERDPAHALWQRGPVEVVPPPGDPALAGVAISNHLIGQVFGSDPGLVWIDGYGLIDPYVARCPITQADPRPGHAERLVPRAYLRARGDVRQLPRGRERLDARDASLAAERAAMQAEPHWPSDEHRMRYEELELLTRAPLWAPARLRLIPKYLLGGGEVPPVAAHEAFDILGSSENDQIDVP
jgi:arabinofuranosyltransferase